MEQNTNDRTSRDATLGFTCGVLIGVAAGMIGVGGGEFRIPVLLHVLRLPVRVAAAANTIIGLAVVLLGAVRRLPQHEWGTGDVALVATKVVASAAGAYDQEDHGVTTVIGATASLLGRRILFRRRRGRRYRINWIVHFGSLFHGLLPSSKNYAPGGSKE